MKKLYILGAGVLAIALASCQNETKSVVSAIDPEKVVVTNDMTPEEYLQLGVINIKITPEFAKEVESHTGEDGKVNVKAVKSMGFAIKDLGIMTMERLFPYAGKFEARTREAGLHLWYSIRFDEDKSITKAKGDLRTIPGITIIDPAPKIEITGNPEVIEYVKPAAAAANAKSNIFNDPLLEDQWHYYNDGSKRESQSGCDINVVPVWKSYTTGNPDVVVAVVDGGIDYTHEDLADNMWHDPEDNRRVGYNFITNNYVITPHHHGTHVAGTIAAVNNNGIGVSGIAGGNAALGEPGVKLMSCQIFSEDGGSGSGEKAIVWAADHGAVISQNSWGMVNPCETPKALKDAVDYFTKNAGLDENGKQVGPMAGGIVIFSAGNENSSEPYGGNYEKMLTVTSVGADYVRAYYSNYGDWCDIAAPGGDARKGNQIISTLPGNSYGKMQGTSMACPHVSGVAALVISKKGGFGFTNTALRELLVNSATDISAYNRNYYMGSGLVNAYSAIAGSGGKAPERITSFSVEKPSSNIVTFTAEVPADEDDGKPNTIIVYYSEKPIIKTDGLQFSSFYVNDTKVGKNISGKIIGLDFKKTYYFAAAACDLAGNKSALSETRTVITGDNHAPAIDIEGPTDLVLKGFESRTINFSFNDPDGHFTTIELKKGSEAETLDTLVMTSPKIKIEGIKANPGNYESTIVVTDNYGLAASKEIKYTILDNIAPAIVKEIPDCIFNSKSENMTLNADDYFIDEDGEPLSYTIVNMHEDVINVNYSKGKIYLTPMGYGYADITIIAMDAREAYATQRFRILVRDGNEPVEIYPNPVSDYLYVRTGEDATATLKLINTMGATVYEKSLEITPFEPAKVDVTALPAGVYTVSLDYNGTKTSKSVVKL